MRPYSASRTDRQALACLLLDHLAAAAPGEHGKPGRFVSIEGEHAESYQLGMLDMLATFGLVEQSNDGLSARPVSPQAGWALRILGDLIDHGAPLVADWHSNGLSNPDELRHPFARATDFLQALDRRRYELMPTAAPVRENRAAVALMPRSDAQGRLEFLLVYDADAQAWQLPGGRHIPGDASNQDTLRRELYEELGLGAHHLDQFVLFEHLPTLLHTRESPTYGPRSRTAITPFLLLGAHDLADDGCSRRWFDEHSIRAGQSDDGARIAAEPLLVLLDEPEFNLRHIIAAQSANLLA